MPLARRRGASAEACCQVFDTRSDQRRISVYLHVFCLLPCGKKMECRICNQRISFVKGSHPGRKRKSTRAVHESELSEALTQANGEVVTPHPALNANCGRSLRGNIVANSRRWRRRSKPRRLPNLLIKPRTPNGIRKGEPEVGPILTTPGAQVIERPWQELLPRPLDNSRSRISVLAGEQSGPGSSITRVEE